VGVRKKALAVLDAGDRMTAPAYQVVSLGPACNVKYQIDHYTRRRQETHLFDWQMVDLPTICQILRTADPATLFRRDALEIYGNNATRTHVQVTSLPEFKSIHDVRWPWTEADLAEYVEKQVRRTRRLVDLIRSGMPIYFVHFAQPGVTAIAEFEATVRSLNPACPFWVFCVGDATGLVTERAVNVHLERVATVPRTMVSWSTPELNWARLFVCIFKMEQGSSLEEAVTATGLVG
jgi:hypothetical protein